MKKNRAAPENTHRIYYFSKTDAETEITKHTNNGTTMPLKYCNTEDGMMLYTRSADVSKLSYGIDSTRGEHERVVTSTPIDKIIEDVETRSPQYYEQMILDETENMEGNNSLQMG